MLSPGRALPIARFAKSRFKVLVLAAIPVKVMVPNFAA